MEPTRAEALQQENDRLRRAVEELSILNDLATAIGASRDLDKVMQTIIQRSQSAVGAEQGVITLVDGQADDPLTTLVRAAGSGGHAPLRPDQSLLGWMHLYKRPLLLNDPQNDPRFQGAAWDASIRSVLGAPLLVRSELQGILLVYNKKDGAGFTESDQRLLSILAAQSAQIVENARLFEEEKALLRVQEELRLAYEMQTSLLPEAPPFVPGYDLAGASQPARTVGGDYFDFIPAGPDRLALCVGDVMGKGLPAALLMANVQATLRGQTLPNISAGACLEQSNTLLYKSIRRGSFVTLFYAVLDTATHRLMWANAGHNRPFLLRAEEPAVVLEGGDLVLGARPDVSYEEHTLDLASGDLLVTYSDGITEAMNAHREDFGEKRLAALLEKHRSLPAETLVERVLEAVAEHAGDEPQHDDVTLLVLRRL